MDAPHFSTARIAAVLAAAVLAVASARTAGAQRSPSTAPPPEGWSRADRWQLALHDGSYLWELALVGLSGDTLVVRQADTLVRVPLERVDELRLVRPSIKQGRNGARATFGGLSGVDDEVYTLARYAADERRRVVEQALAAHPPGAPRETP